MLHSKIKDNLLKQHAEMLAKGDLQANEQLNGFYERFRIAFGPERLRSLDGEDLLNTLHLHGNRESLVYWLEFKNDDEFPAKFGSIAGGSALKFGLYKRKETGAWMTGSPLNQKEISTEQAIAIARKHRDQLIAGAALIEALPKNGSDADYLLLQHRLDKEAPDTGDTAWGHKYLSLLFHEKLDDFHAIDYQRFHLIKCLQVPPDAEGRYVCAGRYVEIARELGFSMNHVTSLLNHGNGRPYRVWRVEARLREGDQERILPLMRDGRRIAIGWDTLGDLSWVTRRQESKDRLRSMIERHYYPGQVQAASRKSGEIFNFVTAEDNDLVLVVDGETILGIGRLSGAYRYDPTPNPRAPHHRPVTWLDWGEWKQPVSEGLGTTFVPIRKDPRSLVAIEERLLAAAPMQSEPTGEPPPSTIEPLTGAAARIQAILDRKGQVILYGPPGTGKTYLGRKTAYDLAALSLFGRLYKSLDPSDQLVITGTGETSGLVRACTFHPNYGYEDFLEGYRPRNDATGGIAFVLRDGIFKQICRDADRQRDRKFFLLIDEINRGDIPRIFGELITLLEIDKRDQPLHLPISGKQFAVPKNVHIIGTMNTADRSIALLDAALRRRFGFVELLPDLKPLNDTLVGGRVPLGPLLKAVNDRIRKNVGRDARNLQIGHAYLLHAGSPVADMTQLTRVLADDIVPLLEEYCYENYDALVEILGTKLVDKEGQRIREELFLPARQDELIDALLTHFEEIATSAETVTLLGSTQDSMEVHEDGEPAS